jgi:hypothetical protein
LRAGAFFFVVAFFFAVVFFLATFLAMSASLLQAERGVDPGATGGATTADVREINPGHNR